MFSRVINKIVTNNIDFNSKNEDVNVEGLLASLAKMGFKDKFAIDDLKGKSHEEIVGIVSDYAGNEYEQKIAEVKQQVLPIEKTMVLKVIDRAWVNHIDIMSKLRDGIHLRSYAQNNPLQAYVQEGYEMFENMMQQISLEIVTFCMNVRIVIERRQK